MSGGAYNYLYGKGYLPDLIAAEEDLEQMADRLAALGYAEDAARETQELLMQLRQWHVRASVKVDRLSEVWRAVEWWDSCDSSEDRVREALTAYRGDKQ